MKENNETIKSKNQENDDTSRRSFIAKTVFAAAGSLILAASPNQANAQTEKRNNTKSAAKPVIGRRKLGKLDVSSIGLGVQNMSRTYQTTVPYRPEMINIIRTAFDRGVTFFDAADVKLTADHLSEIENLTAQIDVQGARYSENAQKMINR